LSSISKVRVAQKAHEWPGDSRAKSLFRDHVNFLRHRTRLVQTSLTPKPPGRDPSTFGPRSSIEGAIDRELGAGASGGTCGAVEKY